jgi:hypothetical protein
MTSKVGLIIAAFKTEITAVTTGYTESKYVYDFTANNAKTSKKIYAVRPAESADSMGANREITLDQTIEVLLSDVFANKGDTDAALQAVIEAINVDIDAINIRLFQRRLNLSWVLVISSIDISAPLIDNNNNNVTLTAKYTVKYKMEL